MFKKNKRNKVKISDIDPDEILLDAFNLPSFDQEQFEGRVEKPISVLSVKLLGVFFVLVVSFFVLKVWDLQFIQGEALNILSEKNHLSHSIIFAKRGVIFDRFKKELVWNVPGEEEFLKRKYIEDSGLSHILGFIGYPERDSKGFWWRTNYVGKSGVERSFDTVLNGENGLKIVEVDAFGNVQSENMIKEPVPGENIVLSIDSDFQTALYKEIEKSVLRAGYVAGAAIVMDVKNGEIIAMASYPEFSSQVMNDGIDREKIAEYSKSFRKPFLNRIIAANYAPGSIVKPYVAVAALSEGIISEWKQILSTGALIIPNPYHPDKPSVFKDWKAHGWVNVRRAIAVSSNVYFYAVGGGLKANTGLGVQEGLGIRRLIEYAKKFGFGQKTGISLYGELSGNIPSPEWKKRVFGDDKEWLLGNTYHSSIGQFGWLVTPIQVVRYVAVLANGGKLVSPHLLKDVDSSSVDTGLDDKYLAVARQGMRLAVTEGTLKSINYPQVKIGAKTGTAQVGVGNAYKNSWVVGFWPYNKPRFAFAVVLERAPISARLAAISTSKGMFNWLIERNSPYLKGEYPSESALGDNENNK